MSDNQDWKAARVGIEEFKNVLGWMINDKYLDTGCCRDVFAIIYGYSSKNNGQYCTFTVSHMANMIPCDRRTISSMINYLLDIGYIGRKPINGKRYKYWALNEEQIEKLNSGRSYKDTISAINGKKFPITNNGKNIPINGKNIPINGKNFPINGKNFPPKYNINNNLNINKYKITDSEESDPTKSDILSHKKKKYKRPTIKEIEARCIEKGYAVDAKEFYDYFKKPNTDWKGVLDTWAKNQMTWKEEKALKAAEKKSKTSFQQNTYDFEALEKELRAN